MTSSLEQLLESQSLLTSNCPKLKIKDWEEDASDSSQDSEIDLLDSDEDDHFSIHSSKPKSQLRKVESRARWDEDMRMVGFMAEQGALVLVDSDDVVLSLKKNMYLMDSLQIYKRLKSLGFIGRHCVKWTLKNDKQHGTTPTGAEDPKDHSKISIAVLGLGERLSITEGLREMRINNHTKPTFDVYLPNNKFKKSSPGEPDFVVYLTRIEIRCKGVDDFMPCFFL
ncbi:hypothetical protein MKW94_017773 [Papaver nudicaule]|uniref:Uncharacterized protein n=1 Tax=Papaver nudicaule TaxID=74823 RepID=A0AA41RXC2_PAPNU|nr:hypothetical protein [Papaver nudicaule]